ncbi:MAG: hypothetical protein GVY08_15070 [Bacteroidetes bacterium]|jgi:hypothetical protein|nr:hypothetical protein [Bacteroidota bacterium]
MNLSNAQILFSKWNQRSILLITVFIFFGFACQENRKFEYHPKLENIPYADRVTNSISKEKSSEILNEQLPDYLINFRKFLESPNQFNEQILELYIQSIDRLEVEAINENSLLMLDFRKRLSQIDLIRGKSTSVASQGRGPGELMGAREMKKVGDFVYILNSDLRISIFDCKNIPCLHQQTIPIKNAVSSIDKVEDSTFVVISTERRSGEPVLENQEEYQIRPLKILDKLNNTVQEFGLAYDTKGHWMLERPMIDYGTVLFDRKREQFIVIFERFPFIYIYNKQFKLDTLLRIESFIIGKQKYWPDTGRLRTIQNDHSLIKTVRIFDNKYLLVKVNTKKDYAHEDNSLKNYQYDYYAVNLTTFESYYLGQISMNQEFDLFITKYGVLYAKNDNIKWTNL